MTSDPDDRDEREDRRQNNDYEVGRNRPPRDRQFRKGTSGNKNGRPKGSLNIKTGVLEVLSKRIPVHENGKKRRIPTHQAMFLRNVAKAIDGDQRAYANVQKTIDKYIPQEAKSDPDAEPSEALQLAHENYRARIREELKEEIRAEVLAELERDRRGRS